MKILITTDVYEPTVNGVVTSIKNLQNTLTGKGHEVRILTLSGSRNSYKDHFVYYLGSIDVGKIYPQARAAVIPEHKIIQELEEWKPDVVHSQSEFTVFYHARKIAKKTGAPLVHTYHTIYEDYTHYFSPNVRIGKRMAAFLTRKMLKKADGIIAPTEKVESLLNSYGINGNIFVLPTGISLDSFYEASREKACYGQRISSGPVLITVGRIGKEKNLDEILRMLNTERGRRYQWILVGDGPYRRILEEKVRKAGLSYRVTFTGMISQDQVAKYYQLGDVFVSASQSETQGLTYVEALAAGLPVVAKRDHCLNGVVLNGWNGWQYDKEEDFFKALEELFPENMKGYGKVTGWQYQMCSVNAGQSAWKFSKESFGLGAEKIYRRLLMEKEQKKAVHFLWNHPMKRRIHTWMQ